MPKNSDSLSSVSNSSSPVNLAGTGDASKRLQIPAFPCPPVRHGDLNMLPAMYPVLLPGLLPAQMPDQMNRGPGIYAVPVLPYMGTVIGIPTNTLVPLTYSTPTRATPSEAEAGGGEQRHVGQQQPQQLAPQRQIGVRRFQFQIAFQLDLMLILKLAAVVFIFNQDGSRQRLTSLVLFACIVYLYQTGTLTPLMRWVSQAMHRAAAPPQAPRPAARVEPIVRQGDENIGGAAADGQVRAENRNPPADHVNHVAENEAAPDAGVEGANHWWGIVKEIQMIVFGFITSLLPGFRNVDHA